MEIMTPTTYLTKGTVCYMDYMNRQRTYLAIRRLDVTLDFHLSLAPSNACWMNG
jgi:hypothetical protein